MPESISKVTGETEYLWSQHCPCESFNLLICQYLSLRLFKQDMHLLIGHANMQKAIACQVTVPPWELTFQQIVGTCTCNLPDLEIESFSLFYQKIWIWDPAEVCEVVGISEQSRTFVVFQIPTPSSHGNQQRSALLCCGVNPKPILTLCPDTFLQYQVRSQVVQLCMHEWQWVWQWVWSVWCAI